MTKNLTTFLVDDDSDDQDFFAMALNAVHPAINCVFADDGLHALEKLNNITLSPDIIFIDINMPRMNGISFLSELKKNAQFESIPAYMYSTFADARTIELCKKLGALGFIKKYTSILEAKEAFRKLLTKIEFDDGH